MHTRPGQAAIKRLMSVPVVASALDMVAPAHRKAATFEAVFAVEGGKLARRVSSPQIDALAEEIDDLVLAYNGVVAIEQRRALLSAVTQSLPELHRFRREIVLGQSDQRKTA